tara:strand:- start:20 stop:2887 length:2868 start_codon:yes stop_codon:yes gene_type:complete
MALSPQLLQFKSSGVYRLEFDKSQTVNIPAETIRLVVGRSKKGPYNTPVLVEDVEQFKQVFGGVDKSLERKGMYFHRSAIEALSRGPILALNLTADDAADRVSVFSPATNSSQEGLSANTLQASNAASKKFTDVFDTDKFWVPNDEKLLVAAAEDTNHAISFVNIKQDPITVIIRQAADTRGFELTAREWYGETGIPEGIDADEYVSDYLVDVFVFKGKFDSDELNNDPNYGTYFDENGLIKSEFAKFAGLREVTLLAQYNGLSLIPEFMDAEGNQMYIETLINLEARRTGLFCAVQEDALPQIDLIGNGFDIRQDYEVLSHKVLQEKSSTDLDLTNYSGIVSVDGSIVTINGTGLDANTLANDINDAKFLTSSVSTEYVAITGVSTIGVSDGIIIEAAGPVSKSYENFGDANAATWQNGVTMTVDANGNLIISEAPFNYGNLQNGGNYFLLSENANEYVAINDVSVDAQTGVVTVSPAGSVGFSASYAGANLTSLAIKQRAVTVDFKSWSLQPNARTVMFPTLGGDGWDFGGAQAGRFTYSKAGDVYFPVDAQGVQPIKVGMYVPGDGGKLSRIKSIKRSVENGTTYYRFESHRAVSLRPEYALKRYEETSGFYKTFPLEGATQTEKTIQELLTAIKPGTGLGNALVDKDNITFRYVVDTFGSLEAGGILNKEELSFLCKERQNASAILNAPMVKEFKAATNPSFKDSTAPYGFSVNHVATGGNLENNPTQLYTLPSINEGANYAFYYGPGLNVIENGRTKVIPPAAYVSNNYIDKFLDALPWSIIAGPRRGVVGGTGVQSLEFAFDKNDRDVLEPFGYNPIVFERGVGLTIKGNKTAQQGIQSALSSAHVREVLIYIEDGLAEILKNYLFEFNSAQTRLEIKTLADNFMESVKKDGGVYDYKNIMDTSNNTNEVIDNNMGILDTFVEPVKGLEILVSRVTVLNTGEIATGNFA